MHDHGAFARHRELGFFEPLCVWRRMPHAFRADHFARSQRCKIRQLLKVKPTIRHLAPTASLILMGSCQERQTRLNAVDEASQGPGDFFVGGVKRRSMADY